MEWIKIEDEKPYEYEMVLLVDNLGQKYYGTLLIEGENHFINDCCSGELVTHWMPFPRLPKNQEKIMNAPVQKKAPKKNKKKQKPVKFEWCFCCKDLMQVSNDGQCTVCYSYIVM